MPERVYYSDEAERVAKRQQALYVLLFMVLGLAAGAIIAVLLAPDEGAKTRRLIADALEDGYRRGREATVDSLVHLEPEFPNLREKVNGMLSNIRR
jgi:gas vesicle protein